MVKALCAPALLFLTAVRVSAAGDDVPTFTTCEEMFARKPQAREPADCFYLAGREPGRTDEAIRRLEALIAGNPRSPWLSFNLARLVWSDPERSADASRRALAEFVAQRDSRGEVLTRFNLGSKLYELGRVAEAGEEAERAAAVAERSRDPELVARAKVNLARHLHRSGGDLARAILLFQEAEPALFPAGPYLARRDWLLSYSEVLLELGWRREAAVALERLAEMLATAGAADPYTDAKVRYGLARVAFAEAAELPSEHSVGEARRRAREALALAVAAGHTSVEAQAQHMLGRLGTGPAARDYLERCVAAAPTDRDRSFCLHALTRHLTDRDPAQARVALDRAFALARTANDPYALIYCWRERMRLAWVNHPPERALAQGRAALDVIEALHDVQRNTGKKAELFSTWAEDYHWLSGRLLQAGRLAEAFAIAERMRARSLVEELEGGERLVQPTSATYRRPEFTSLPAVRRELAADEALLSVQVAPWRDAAGDFAGGAWLLAVTRQGARAYRLPGRVELRQTIAIFDGLFAARTPDGEASGARAFHRRLLKRALADLPPRIERLILVPDDDLHRLPFAALRAEDGRTLGGRYQLTVVPSATLWLRWTEDRPEPGVRPALALADPPVLGGTAAADRGVPAERGASFAEMRAFPPLPYARDEGRAVVRHVGAGSLLRVGAAASEDFLKRAGGRFGLYHFATHAFLDDERPERSWVLLAPGARDQDGLLQAHEIAELDFQGAAVVLASCRSASGRVLRGEGVMGLARAFFQAGAHAVVASLWPLRDDDAEALFASFYRHLGRGESLAAALRAAQAERIRAGAPAAAWAGLVVLGDGELAPVRPRPAKRWIATALLAAYGAGALLFAARAPRRTLEEV